MIAPLLTACVISAFVLLWQILMESTLDTDIEKEARKKMIWFFGSVFVFSAMMLSIVV